MKKSELKEIIKECLIEEARKKDPDLDAWNKSEFGTQMSNLIVYMNSLTAGGKHSNKEFTYFKGNRESEKKDIKTIKDMLALVKKIEAYKE